MAMQSTSVETPKLWGRFDSIKDRLFNQYTELEFDPDTGLSLDELEAEVSSYLKAHPDQSRILQKANVFRLVLTRGQIAIDPEDWFVDKINHGCPVRNLDCEKRPDKGGIIRKLTVGWLDEAIEGLITKGAEFLHRAYRVGQAKGPQGGLDRSHIAPGWDKTLENGLAGLLEEVRTARESLGERATREQLDFYEAVEIVYGAAIELAGRYARLATDMAQKLPEHRERLELIASAMSNVPANRPRTFHEALQFMWLMHELIEMEGEFVRSMGQFDRTLYPFYRADIDSGLLTRAQAKELILFFWYKWYSRTQGRENGKNFCFGGQYPDGSEITNDLTYLAFEAYEEIATPDPKLSLRLLPDSPEKLYRRVADLIRNGRNSFVLMNDPPAVEALVRRGKTLEDARYYLPIGCYEPAVEGKEVGCTMNITVNLVKGVELALNDGRDPLTGEQVGPHTGDPRDFHGFEELWKAYTRQMDAFLEGAVESIGAAERAWPQISPSPFIAATIDDCIADGKDISAGGAHYNSVGFVGTAIANTCDSLLALKKAVYEEKRYTIEEILEALRDNFEGNEVMRQYLLNRIAKWGNNDEEADELAERIAEYYCNKVHSFRNGRGGPCQAALFSLTFALEGGRLTGALPDGRRSGESLAPGIGASYGRDRNGVTALLESVAKLDSTLMPNGAVLDVTLHPSAVEGEEGLQALIALIKTFFSKGGYALQFNIFDTETLRDAQRFPERYANLQVRVTGWSVYFTSMSSHEQDQYIARITHGN